MRQWAKHCSLTAMSLEVASLTHRYFNWSSLQGQMHATEQYGSSGELHLDGVLNFGNLQGSPQFGGSQDTVYDPSEHERQRTIDETGARLKKEKDDNQHKRR